MSTHIDASGAVRESSEGSVGHPRAGASTGRRPRRARLSRSSFLGAGALLCALSACATSTSVATTSQVCAAPERTTRHELLFGLGKPDGTAVTAAEFDQFVDQVVTPRFEQGLTVIESRGQWRYADGRTAKEPSRVLVLIDPDDAETRQDIEAIITEYRRRFQQESVGWVRSPVLVCF
jgi:hypothetical protein